VTLEEAFANYIGSGLAGTSLASLQRWASQVEMNNPPSASDVAFGTFSRSRAQ